MTFFINTDRFVDGSPLVLPAQMEAEYTLRAKVGGKVVRERTFKNLITNQGLDFLGATVNLLAFCQVGTGTSVPLPTDTSLGNRLAVVAGLSSYQSSTAGAAPDYANTGFQVYVFPLGAVVGNITEVGVGTTNAVSSLFSRALVLDQDGVPVAFPVQASEQLEVTYAIRTYPPITDLKTTQKIGNTTHNVTVRPYQVTSAGGVWGIVWNNALSGAMRIQQSGLFTGPMSAITSNGPSGSIGIASPIDNDAYVNGSKRLTCTATFGPTQGNGNIKTVTHIRGCCRFQIEFETPLVKTNLQRLILPYTLAWDRR